MVKSLYKDDDFHEIYVSKDFPLRIKQIMPPSKE